MIHGLLDDTGTRDRLLGGVTWARVFDWMDSAGSTAELGRHEILAGDVHAVVMGYSTVARELARFESHREFVDLQYTIEGDEQIDWFHTSNLVPDGPFENDIQFWQAPVSGWSSLHQSAGHFAVFYPNDAHRPRIQAISGHVRKIVVKVRVRAIV